MKFGFLRHFNDEQRKASSDLSGTIAKLFVGGGMVSPFLNQTDVGLAGSVLALGAGLAFHGLTLYILRTRTVPDE